ncbi:MAG: SMC-Scp complex subunit ScpB [Promethearchaeota archaeon]
MSREGCYSIEIEERARHQRLKYDKIKREIEAALFKARRILSLEELCKLYPKYQKTKILELIRDLIDEYKEVQTALEIAELVDTRFELKIKDPILNSIGKFTQGNLLRNSDVKTLSIIAFLQPNATRKKIRAKLGGKSTMYRNIKNLKELKFITENDSKFYLTRYFYDYFQLKENSNDIVKNLLQNFK